jgi:hypothetical protein
LAAITNLCRCLSDANPGPILLPPSAILVTFPESWSSALCPRSGQRTHNTTPETTSASDQYIYRGSQFTRHTSTSPRRCSAALPCTIRSAGANSDVHRFSYCYNNIGLNESRQTTPLRTYYPKSRRYSTSYCWCRTVLGATELRVYYVSTVDPGDAEGDFTFTYSFRVVATRWLHRPDDALIGEKTCERTATY